MTRHARRASLLVALSLLTSAATAHAECAWVLWIEESWSVVYQRDEQPTTWTLVEALPLRADCERAVAEKVKRLSTSATEVHGNVINKTFPRSGYEQTNKTRSNRVICFPDTVDPRGPKGK